MFKKDKFKKLGEDIYVFNNFLTEEECNSLSSIAKSYPEDEWRGRFYTEGEGHKTLEKNIYEIEPLHDRIKEMLSSGVHIGPSLAIVRMKKGSTWGLHSDNHDFLQLREDSKLLKDGEDFDLVQNTIFGLVMYFNDFDGGCLYYPNQGVRYQPLKGDLVIHSSEEHCMHGVDELISEERYSHSNYLFEYIKVPRSKNVI